MIDFALISLLQPACSGGDASMRENVSASVYVVSLRLYRRTIIPCYRVSFELKNLGMTDVNDHLLIFAEL